MRYRFTSFRTVEDLLEAIGRGDIPSPEVSMTRVGDQVEIDFGEHALNPGDEEKLKSVLSAMGYGKLRAKE